jgi:hypothetical protein
MFDKSFASFRDGLAALMLVSFSARQALTMSGDVPDSTEEEALAAVLGRLAVNAASDSQPDSVCSLTVRGWQVRYTTCQGLAFGWSYRYDHDHLDGEYTMFVDHPHLASQMSTLRRSCEAQGWHDRDGVRQFFTVAEVAGLHQVSVPTVTKWCRDGALTAEKRGAGSHYQWIVPVTALETFQRPKIGGSKKRFPPKP